MTDVAPPAVTVTTPEPRPTLWLRAPGWVFYGFTGVGALGLLWSASYPVANLAASVLAVWWLGVCALVWTVRLITYVVGRRSPQPAGSFARFLIAPAGGVLVVAALVAGAPLHARWAPSQAAFDSRADHLLSVDGAIGDGRVGLYRVEDSWSDDDGNVYFSIADSGFIDGGGFARLPDGPPPGPDGEEYQRVHGDWYTFVVEF